MQEMQLYEYAVMRVVPRVDREEFVNVGVIVYCKAMRYLACSWLLPENKITHLDVLADVEEIKAHLRSFETITNGNNNGHPIALLDIAARFRWLTATRSTILQCSKIHIGRSFSPEKELEALMEKFVL